MKAVDKGGKSDEKEKKETEAIPQEDGRESTPGR